MQADSKAAETKTETRIAVYMGRGTLTTNKAAARFWWCTAAEAKKGVFEHDPMDETVVTLAAYELKGLRKTPMSKHQVGAMFEVKVENIGADGRPQSIYPGTAKFIGYWPDAKKRTEWQLREQATERAIEARRDENRAKTEASWQAQLEPVRQAYRKSVGIAKPQLLAAVVEYITRSGGF